MTKRPEYQDGAPCWSDLCTPDLAGAQRFYGGLFGWQFDTPNPKMANYANIRKDGERVAGVMPMQPSQPAPAWSVHFKSSDLDATERRITEAGGQIVYKHGMELGGMMLAVDPTGLSFDVWEPRGFAGAELFATPGAMCWHELHTHEAEAADRFYRAVFEYEQVTMRGDGSRDYMIYGRGGEGVVGRMKTDGAAPAHWRTFFAVADLDAALAKLGPLEGKLLEGPIATPYGPVARVADPYGAMFMLIEQRPA